MKPPKMKFISKIWHPNVHDNGEVSNFFINVAIHIKLFRSAFLFYTIPVMINMDMKKHLNDGYQSIP